MTAIPVIRVAERDASEAFEVHRALVAAERRCPALKRNPRWIVIRQDAYEAFAKAFEVLA